jgi:hypothetical protein
MDCIDFLKSKSLTRRSKVLKDKPSKEVEWDMSDVKQNKSKKEVDASQPNLFDF